MSVIETGSLIVLAVVGLGITYFGFEATQAMLAYGGMAAGAVIGGWAGIVVAPRIAGEAFTSNQLLLVAGGCVLVGAIVGRAIIPDLGRLAITCLAFTLTAAAAFIIGSEGGALETMTQTVPRVLETGNPDLFYDRFAQIEFVGGADPQLAALGIFFVAAAGAGLAIAHADFILTALITLLGALLLGAVIPILVGSADLSNDSVSAAFSMFWFLVFAVTGVVFEALRYSEEVDPSDFLGL
jgi:hypothetical protein